MRRYLLSRGDVCMFVCASVCIGTSCQGVTCVCVFVLVCAPVPYVKGVTCVCVFVFVCAQVPQAKVPQAKGMTCVCVFVLVCA